MVRAKEKTLPPEPMLQSISLWCYTLLWIVAIPFLPLNKRLREGYRRRLLHILPGEADLWIQAASVGESFLALELIKHLQPQIPIRVLLTTGTSQGLKILEDGAREYEQKNGKIKLGCTYFPFDKPGIMDKAMKTIRPSLVIILESEIWPGLLSVCKKTGIEVLLVNGRMTSKSLSRYMIWPSLWRRLGPDKILAMSEDDAGRFATLFGREKVAKIHNIKFDRVSSALAGAKDDNPLARLIKPETAFFVLGSVRQEEEKDITGLIGRILAQKPDAVIGVFPRHMHRLTHWQKILAGQGFSWQLRSDITEPVSKGLVILWDTMGELVSAYAVARAAFVGGSLAPLGGQNFLEPLTCGVYPVIGPHWRNFEWIGQEIIDQGLVHQVKDWCEAADCLLRIASQPVHRDGVRAALDEYVRNRRGGTEAACKVIRDMANRSFQATR